TVVMVSDTTVTATFNQENYTLTINITGNGSVVKTPDQPTYVYGDTVIVDAVPDPGWAFDSWSDGLTGSEDPDTLVMISDTTVTATFVQENYTLTINITGNGSVTKTPDQPTYLYGDTVIVEAFPDAGWAFDSWSGGLTGSENPDTVVMVSDTTVTATFVEEGYVLTININGNGSVTKTPDQPTYVYGDTVIVEAVPDPGWTFDGWSDGLTGSENPDTVVMISDTTVTATFLQENYTLTININGDGSVTKTPDQPTYVYGDTVIVEAVPDPGWAFDSWSDGLSGSENPDTVVMVSDTTVTATFVQENYTLAINITGNGSVTKTPDQPTYVQGDTVVVEAFPDAEWVFDSWSDGLTGSENPDTVVMVSDTTVTAIFKLEAFQSDDFSSTTLDTTLWRFIDPVGDVTLVLTGTNLVFYVPGGTRHNISDSAILAPRLMQDAADKDFEIEAKFDSRGSLAYQGQGFLVQEDEDTYLRFDVIFSSGNPRVFAAYYDQGSVATKVDQSVPETPPYLRVTRTADSWEYQYSNDGTIWNSAVTFSQSLTVTEVGLVINNSSNGGVWLTPAFVGNVDYFFNTAGPLVPEDQGNPSAETPPRVEVWYGTNQNFGQLGIPQQWVNILGRVWDTEEVDTLYYSLNGGAASSLTIGPDGKRLVGVGDYNIEIDYADLSPGANQVVVTAIDTLGERQDTTVTVNYTDGVTWAMPYTADWLTAGEIGDVAHVVDGRWYLVDGEGVRVDSSATGYDRLLVMGDHTWMPDYEVLVPMTIDAGSLGSPSGVGIGIGWLRHIGAEQPRLDVLYHAISWVKDVPNDPKLYLQNDDTKINIPVTVVEGVRYWMRTRSQSLGTGLSRVSTKIWEDGGAEPPDWDITYDFPTVLGSVILIAHRSIATFGNVTITPLPSLAPHELTLNVIGNGAVGKVPDQTSYADGDTVIVTATPADGWVFDSWSDGLSGSENPDTIVMFSDTTVTATFIEENYVLTTNVNGSGTVQRTPDQPTYNHGDTVVVNAIPAGGWEFTGWSDGLSGTENPDTVIMLSDTTVTANFVGGPIAYWMLDESDGTTAVDSVGSNHGTLNNGPVWRPSGGKINGALEFDGSDDYVDLGTMDVSTGSGISIVLWFRADDFDQHDGRFISKAVGPVGDDHYWMVSTVDSTGLRFRVKTGGVTTTLSTATGEIQAGEWYHVAATYDGANMRIYKNAVVVAETGKTGKVDSDPGAGVALGNQPPVAGGRPFDGLLDDVRVYDRGLDSTEVALLANPGTNTPPLASFVATPKSGAAPLEVSFDASGSTDPDGDTLSFSWDFGDGTDPGTGETVVHTYTAIDTYLVTLTVTDTLGKTDTATDTIMVDTMIPFALTINIVGAGTVERLPDQSTYVYGDTVILTAQPDTGWFFDSWTDGLTGSENPDTVVIASDTTVTAIFDIGTGIDRVPSVKTLTVRQNHPNPFAVDTYIEYGLPRSSGVEILIYDVAGKRVFHRRISNAQRGWNNFVFRGIDQDGRPLASGVYFYQVRTRERSVTKKMVVLR
ncbi:MAG: PKD domain-containing protein, partial [Candidatus Latescibacterota bacterium]